MPSDEPTEDLLQPESQDPCDGDNNDTPPPPPAPSVEVRLAEIASQLTRGIQPQKQTVRALLGWVGVSRRGFNVSADLRAKLSAVKLKTEPDFEYAYIDDVISFVPNTTNVDTTGGDPSYRIGQLEAANRKPIMVSIRLYWR